MDNANITEPPFLPAATKPGPAMRDDSTGKDDGNNLVLILPVVLVAVLCIFVCAIAFVYNRRHITAAQTSEHPEKEDAVLDEEKLGSLTPVATDLSEVQHIDSREPRLLDPEGTWRNAKFLFPGLLNDITLSEVEGKYMNKKYGGCEHLNIAIRAEMHDKLQSKISVLSKKKDWERLNETQNAADLCIAVGMNPEAVKLRFQLIENLEKELPFPLHKSHILNTVEHVIDTIHVNNPFGDGNDIDGKIHGPNFHEKPWLSYLGVNWRRCEIKEKTTEVENQIKAHVSSRNGFFVHGTTGDDLIKFTEEEDGELLRSRSEQGSLKHDFGPGFYCFKNQLQWALSFALVRCFPIYEGREGKAEIKSCNPAVIVFLEHDHTIFNHPEKALNVRGKPMGSKELKGLNYWSKYYKDKYDAFMDCRKKWKDDDELGYWKDFVKMSLIYDRVPPKAEMGGYLVFYGPMRSCEEGDKPTGDKEPKVDADGWTQYCFLGKVQALGRKRIFVEFNVDWKEWLEPGEEYEVTKKKFEAAQQEIESHLEKKETK